MVLHCQIMFSLATAATAEAIPMWTSAEQEQTLYRVAPRYLKLVTSSTFWPFMLIVSTLMLFMLLVTTLLFSVLTSIPYAVALWVCWWSWGSPLLLPIRLMLLANHRLHVGLPPMEIDVWWSWSVVYMIFPRNKSNRMDVISIPDGLLLLSWRTPLADCSIGLQCWSSHIVPECLQLVLHLHWSFWRPVKGLHASECGVSLLPWQYTLSKTFGQSEEFANVQVHPFALKVFFNF